MRGALADPRRAPHGARAVALEGRALIGVHVDDPQVLADELVVVLGVGHGGLEQLAPSLRRAARGEGEDRASLLDVLPADVVAHEPRLAGGRAHVLGLGGDHQPDRHGLGLVGLAATAATALGLVLGVVLAAAPAHAARRLLGLVGGLLGLVGGLLGLAGLASAPALGGVGGLLGGLLGLGGELLGFLGSSDRRLRARLLGGLGGLLGCGSGASGLLVGALLLIDRDGLGRRLLVDGLGDNRSVVVGRRGERLSCLASLVTAADFVGARSAVARALERVGGGLVDAGLGRGSTFGGRRAAAARPGLGLLGGLRL